MTGAKGHVTSLPGLRGTVGEVPNDNPDVIDDMYAEAEHERLRQLSCTSASTSKTLNKPSLLRDVLNISHVLTDGAAAIVDDSFNKCFTSAYADPWNWNAYLFPAWLIGVVFRYFILFPIRLVVLLIMHMMFFIAFFGVGAVMKPGKKRKALELQLVQVSR